MWIQSLAAFMLLGAPIRESQEDKPTLSPVVAVDAIRFVQVFSEDRQAGTFIFDNFLVGTEVGRGSSPSVATKTFTYVLEPKATKTVRILQVIRGYLSYQGGASVALMVHSGGSTTVLDLAKVKEDVKNGVRVKSVERLKKATEAAKAAGIGRADKPEESTEYLVEIDRDVAAGAALQTTIFMLVDRPSGSDEPSALLTVDSIDCEVFEEASDAQ